MLSDTPTQVMTHDSCLLFINCNLFQTAKIVPITYYGSNQSHGLTKSTANF